MRDIDVLHMGLEKVICCWEVDGVLIDPGPLEGFAEDGWIGHALEVGPRLLGFKWGDTDLRVSAIPLGGYVKLEGEPEDHMSENTAILGGLMMVVVDRGRRA